MKRLTAILSVLAFGMTMTPVMAQDSKPKSTGGQIDQARKQDHTTRQVTPDPKKSPGKHADNLSKNVNHEMTRTSDHVSRMFKTKHNTSKKHHNSKKHKKS